MPIMNSIDILLLCDENHCFLSSNNLSSPPSTPTDDNVVDDDDDNEILRNYLRRELTHMPRVDYLEQLQLSADLASARTRALRLIIMVHGRLGLGIGTLFAAANYLDRFVSMNICINWEVWLIELLAIACLSLASKVDEVFVPLLHDFQTEDLDHTFEPSTIKRMELTVLKALDWRLTCITPYSYIGILIQSLGFPQSALTTRTTELLLQSLLEVEFVEFRASSIAIWALKSALEELVPLESDGYLDILKHLIPVEVQAEIDKCQWISEKQTPKPLFCPQSPVTVIPPRRTEVSRCFENIDSCFFLHEDDGENINPKKRKKTDALASI